MDIPIDKKPQVFVLSFESTFAALAAQKALAAIKPAVIPVPREISASCGMALRFKALTTEEARSLVEEALSEDERKLSALYEDGGSAVAFGDSRYRKI